DGPEATPYASIASRSWMSSVRMTYPFGISFSCDSGLVPLPDSGERAQLTRHIGSAWRVDNLREPCSLQPLEVCVHGGGITDCCRDIDVVEERHVAFRHMSAVALESKQMPFVLRGERFQRCTPLRPAGHCIHTG